MHGSAGFVDRGRRRTHKCYNLHSTVDMLMTLNSPLMPKPDIGRKSQFLPQLGGPSWNTAIAFGMEKLEWCGYSTATKLCKICLLVSTE